MINEGSDNLERSTSETPPEFIAKLPDYISEDVLGALKVSKGLFRHRSGAGVEVFLLDAGLWDMFRQIGTEMIITKKGRRVFPTPTYIVCGLNPNKLYNISIKITPMDNAKHKFLNGMWVQYEENAHTLSSPFQDRNTYLHPASPNTGDYWMKSTISFSSLKISNNAEARSSIVLQSMRRYQMSLVVSQQFEIQQQPEVTIPQAETQFVAVTQYQNLRITQMKIEHNPFANSFRMKRLGKSHDEDDEDSSTESGPCSGPSPSTHFVPLPVGPLGFQDYNCLPTSSSGVVYPGNRLLLQAGFPKTDFTRFPWPWPSLHREVGLPKLGQPAQPFPTPSHAGVVPSLYILPPLLDNDCANPRRQMFPFAAATSRFDTPYPEDSRSSSARLTPYDDEFNSDETRHLSLSSVHKRIRFSNYLTDTPVFSKPDKRRSDTPEVAQPTQSSLRVAPKCTVMFETTENDTRHEARLSLPDRKESTCQKPELTLEQMDLWADINEMVVCEMGRPMYPHLCLQARRLEPDRLYSFCVELCLTSPWLHEYKGGGWTPVEGAEEYTHGQWALPYQHPNNPTLGRIWEAQGINFYGLYLSTTEPDKNRIKVLLRRQYFPIVTIYTQGYRWQFPLREATFVTVGIDRHSISRPAAIESPKRKPATQLNSPSRKGFQDIEVSPGCRKQLYGDHLQ